MEEKNIQERTFSIKLWPPSQSTRKMLVERIAKNLSTESIFSRKYGLLSEEEAYENAKAIEEECYLQADERFNTEPDEDGSSSVQLYAKETSKQMLQVLKKGTKSKADGVVAKTVFDISDGRRAFIEAEEAQKLLAPLAVHGNAYSNLCFSNRSFGAGAARVAGPILASIKHQLQEVDLSDFVAGRPEEEALEVMQIFSSALEGSVLKYLNLSDNALGEKGVRAFGLLLKSQHSLEELYLVNDGISEEAAAALCELIPSTEKLKILHFHNNMTGDAGAVAISKILERSPLLENFRCSSTRVGSTGGIALAKALATCGLLKKLDIRDNLFGTEAGLALSVTLGKLSNIVEIYLSFLNLEDEGTIAITNSLKQTVPRLEILELAGNEITADAASALSDCLTEMQSLRKLNLSDNELKDDGVTLIAKSLHKGHKVLEELDFSNTSLTRLGAESLATVVSNKPKFVLLNVNGNFITEEGIEEMKMILDMGESSANVLGPLDENDPDGVPDEDEDKEVEEEGNDNDISSKMQNLKVEND